MKHSPVHRLTFAAGALALACGGSLFNITLEDESLATIEQGTLVEALIGDLGFGEFINMDITQSEELQNQGVSPGDIDGVHLQDLRVELLSPEGADFTFIDAIDFYVEAPDLPRTLIAESDPIEDGDTAIEFTLADEDLTAYAVSQTMTFTTEVSGRRPDVDVDIRASYEIQVGVTQQGCARAVKGE